MKKKKKKETMRRDLKRDLEKIRRRRLYHLPPVSVIVLFFVLVLNFILFLIVLYCE